MLCEMQILSGFALLTHSSAVAVVNRTDKGEWLSVFGALHFLIHFFMCGLLYKKVNIS